MATIPPHPNVVQLIGFCQQPIIILTEFIENGSLGNYLSQPIEISVFRMVLWLLDICYGLAHLHLYKIIHRDLAVRNVLLRPSLEAVLSDFGLSRKTDESEGKTRNNVGPLKVTTTTTKKISTNI